MSGSRTRTADIPSINTFLSLNGLLLRSHLTENFAGLASTRQTRRSGSSSSPVELSGEIWHDGLSVAQRMIQSLMNGDLRSGKMKGIDAEVISAGVHYAKPVAVIARSYTPQPVSMSVTRAEKRE